MIERIVVVPSAPLLLPEYAGRVDAGAELRDACVALCRDELGTGEPSAPVAVVAATGRDARSSKPPLGLRVAAEVLRRAGLLPGPEVVVPWDARGEALESAAADLHSNSSVLVVADGSARRGEKAPGHLDERAFAFDDALVAALQQGDPDALLALDADLAEELLAQGRAPLQVVAHAMRRAGTNGASAAYRSTFLQVSDPFGVCYVLAALRGTAVG
jgi:hypothetical protein